MPVNKFGYKIETNGRECTACEIFKPWSRFSKDAHAATGHQSKCISCYKNRFKGTRIKSFANLALITPKDDIDLSAILEVKKPQKNSWSFSQAKCLFEGVIKEWNSGNINITADQIATKYGGGKNKGNCIALITELKKAAKEGMKLAEYWKAGRPFSATNTQRERANRVIVPGKKKIGQ